MYELKIYRGVMCHDNEEWYKIEEGLTCCFKADMRNLTNFDPSTWKSKKKKCVLMSFVWPKYVMFELKKYKGVIFKDIEEWCKIWRKTDLEFEKWHQIFSKFSPDHLKISKLGLW